jgi:tetratricopeptide (TPR) repeat protein
MGKASGVRWVVWGAAAAIMAAVALWMGLSSKQPDGVDLIESERNRRTPKHEQEDIRTMDLTQLKAYISACEGIRDLQECERAYKRAIRLTRGDTSRRHDFIQFQFGLAGLYLNCLWEYGQFGSKEATPPALKRAMGIYDDVIAGHPDSPWAAEAQLRKAQLFHNELSGYWNALHRDDAIRELHKVIQQYPGTPQARKAEQMLMRLQKEDTG